jgi:hypothetical protein
MDIQTEDIYDNPSITSKTRMFAAHKELVKLVIESAAGKK